ncbi:MAG: hypothetical protein H6851_11610 [Geminicoccaceae bacterium]|nr:hypothetical protein [Geminicoccaceae bacterium]
MATFQVGATGFYSAIRHAASTCVRARANGMRPCREAGPVIGIPPRPRLILALGKPRC